MRAALELGGQRFTIDSPAVGLEVIERLYAVPLNGAVGDSPPGLRFEVLEIEGGWRLLVNDRTVVERTAMSHLALCLEHEVAQHLLARLGGHLAFHAGAVRVGDGAVLMAGAPDQGKSATTIQLLEMGHSFLCEEISLFDPSARAVEPYPQTPSLTREYLEEVRTAFPVEPERILALDDSQCRYAPARVELEPCPLSTIVFPRYDVNSRPELRDLRPEDCLLEMLGYCFEPDCDKAEFLDVIVDLLEAVPVRRLVYNSVSNARLLLRDLVNEV